MREKERQRDAVCMFLPLCVAEPECMCVCETKKEQQREREKELSSSDMHSSSALQQDFSINIQPIADRVAQNLEIMSKNFQFSTKRTRILMEFMIGTIY